MQQRNEWVVKHAQRTRRFAVVFAVVALSAIFFAAIAAQQRNRAVTSARLAKTNEEEAKANAEKAQASAQEAAKEKEEADEQRKLVSAQNKELEKAREEAETQRKRAEAQSIIATARMKMAMQAKDQEKIARKLAEDKQKEAEALRKLAEENQKEAEASTKIMSVFVRIVATERDAAFFQMQNKFKEALDNYTKLLAVYERLKDFGGQRSTLTQMAQIYHSENKLAEEKNALDRLHKIPTPVSEVLRKAAQENRIESAIGEIRDARKSQPDKYYFSESDLNSLGYDLLRIKRVKEAIEVFKLNVEAYPDRFNTYDSLGEAYMMAGDNELAIRNYKKALELNPKSKNAMEKLKQLGATK